MQVLSCQRAVSLIAVRRPAQAARRASCGAKAVVRHGQWGFTLIELLVTMTIAVVLMMIAVPSFKNITLSNKLTTSANDMVSALNIARMEAIKRNSSTQFCSNSAGANTTGSSDNLGNGCGDETGAVWAMSGTAASQVLAGTPTLVAPLQLKGNSIALRFTAQGLARQVGSTTLYEGTVVDICTSELSGDNHRVITMTAGSILESKPGSGSCP